MAIEFVITQVKWNVEKYHWFLLIDFSIFLYMCTFCILYIYILYIYIVIRNFVMVDIGKNANSPICYIWVYLGLGHCVQLKLLKKKE